MAGDPQFLCYKDKMAYPKGCTRSLRHNKLYCGGKVTMIDFIVKGIGAAIVSSKIASGLMQKEGW